MTGTIMTLYHDHEYKDEDADIEVVVPVTGRVSIQDPGIEVRNIPGAKLLSIVHKGPYETVGVGWTKLHEQLVAEGLEIVGPIREVYLNDPNETPQDELMTELQVPI
jgi:effector-binding domain-containing protein